MSHDLRDRVVVITGGGRGLGRAIADGFVREGAITLITSRDGSRAEAAASEMAAAVGTDARIFGFGCDVGNVAATQALADHIVGRWGAIHVLVNNAGINPWYRKAEDTPVDEWQAVIDTNLTGVFVGCRIFGTQMLAAGRGSIITISSIAGHVGLARSAAYCAAKGGVEQLTKSLAIDWASRGIRVNTVAPAYFETDLTAGLRDHTALSEGILRRTPMGRFGKPDEVVGTCLFLASDAASYITGQSIGVDGGYTAA